jgi:hypothetical protein
MRLVENAPFGSAGGGAAETAKYVSGCGKGAVPQFLRVSFCSGWMRRFNFGNKGSEKMSEESGWKWGTR